RATPVRRVKGRARALSAPWLRATLTAGAGDASPWVEPPPETTWRRTTVPTRTPRRVTTRAFRRAIAAALLALVASTAVATLGQTSQAAPQQATITVLPGIVQPGKKTANAD